MDHVRVHPKFLHSNATSHKWALGGKLDSFLFYIDDYICGTDHFVLVYCDFIKKLFVLLLFAAFAELLDNALDEVSFLYWLLLCCETCNF